MSDIEQRIFDESLRFFRHDDIGALINIAEIHSGTVDDFPFYNNLLWRLYGTIWNDSGRHAKGVAQIMDIMAASYHRFIFRVHDFMRGQFDLNAIRPHIRYRKSPSRPAFLLNSYRPTGSSGSDVLAAYSRHLARDHGHDPCLIGVQAYPAADRAPLFCASIALPGLMVAPGWQTHIADGEMPVPVYATTAGAGLSVDKIVEMIRVLVERQIDVVAGHGGFNVIADVLALLWPTVCLESIRDEAVSVAHAFLSLGGEVTYFRRNHADLYPVPRGLFRLSAAFPVPPRRGLYTRAALGLDEEDFLAAMIGYRLNDEIDDAFADFMVDALRALPRLRFVCAGVNELKFADRLPADLRGRLIGRGVEPAVRDLLAVCDCFVNTPRQGGGAGALNALAEGKPVLTLAIGDVGSLMAPAGCLPDYAAMTGRLVELATDPAARAVAGAAAADLYAQWDFGANVRQVCDAFRSARAVFDAAEAAR